jgi:CRISPR-associated endonuclease Cas2
MGQIISPIHGNRTYIISYDFSNNKLRLKIAKVLEDFGVRLQRSVFSCRLQANQVKELAEKLDAVVTKFRDLWVQEDSLVIIGGLGEEKMSFIVGEPCQETDYMIY